MVSPILLFGTTIIFFSVVFSRVVRQLISITCPIIWVSLRFWCTITQSPIRKGCSTCIESPINTSRMTFLNAIPTTIPKTPQVTQIPVTDCSKTVARTPIIEMQKSNIAVTSFGKRGTGLPDIPAIRPSQKKTVITL